MTDQAQSSKWHVTAKDLLIPLIVGIIGVVGSLGGVYMANSNSAEQAERQKLIEFEAKIFEQRLALIDRTAKVFGKSPALQDVWTQYIDRLDVAYKGKQHTLPMEVIDKLAEAQGEFQSVLFLARGYFGPNTQAAINELSAMEGPWWQKPKDKQDALVMAMLAEASVGLSALPSLGQKSR